jgi:hypothetical protein
MAAFRPSRLGSLLLALAAAVAALEVLSGLLFAAFGASPAWLPPVFSTDRLELFTRRLAAVEQIERTGKVSDVNLVAVLGLSQVRYDLDANVLNANDPRHRSWMILGGDGRNFEQLALFGRTLVDSALRPRLVLLGLAKSMSRREGADPEPPPTLSGFVHHIRHRDLWDALRDCSWVTRQRLRLQEETFLLTYHSTGQLRAVFGLPMSATYVPESDPWSSWTEPSDALPRDMQVDEQWRARQKILTADQFQNNERQIAAFVKLVNNLQNKGAVVAYVMMPETTRLREFHPAVITASFEQAITAADSSTPMHVVDLQSAFKDDEFHDDAHLDGEGRRRMSAILPAMLP